MARTTLELEQTKSSLENIFTSEFNLKGFPKNWFLRYSIGAARDFEFFFVNFQSVLAHVEIFALNRRGVGKVEPYQLTNENMLVMKFFE